MKPWEQDAQSLREAKPKHILFLCVANSARSQMAEGIARHLAPVGVKITSAGSQPGQLNPLAVRALSELGIDITKHYSKGIGEIDQGSVDAVITLCAEEVCPLFPRKVTKLHWRLADPAAAAGGEDQKLDAFRHVRDELVKRLSKVFGNKS